MRFASQWFKQVVIVVAVLGMLTSAWPGVAQSARPPLAPALRDFREQRSHEPGSFPHLPTEAAHTLSVGPSQLWSVYSIGNQFGPNVTIDSKGAYHGAIADEGGAVATLYVSSETGTAWSSVPVINGALLIGSVVVDTADQPHMILGSYDHSYYLYRDTGGSWHTEQMLGGGWTKLVLDTQDNPHIISRQDTGTQALYYIYRDAAGWHTQTIDNFVKNVSSLVLDSAGHPHIVYATTELKYAAWNGVSWIRQTIAGSNVYPQSPSIAFDPAGHLHIVYCQCHPTDVTQVSIKHTYWTGANWQTETADSGVGHGYTPSLVIDAGGVLHVAYLSLNNTQNGYQLNYARKFGATWSIETISVADAPFMPPSITLDHGSQPRIAFLNGWARFAMRSNWLEPTSMAFSSYRDNNSEIYVASGDATYQRRITNSSAADTTPKFNRATDRLAFTSNRNGNYDVFSVNTAGTNLQRLTTTDAHEYRPAWSPDGTKLAFYSYRDGNAEIYVMNADGSGQTRLTTHSAWDGHPVWSPDGSRILFVSERGGSSDLWLMDANGANQHALTSGLNAAYPDWSPDGSRIIFNDDFNSDGWFDLAVIQANGSGLAHPYGATPANYDRLGPVWSPDSQTIAFSTISWILYQGNYYWVNAYLTGARLELTGVTGGLYGLTSSGLDWWPDWQSADVNAPVSAVKLLAVWSDIDFKVEWSGYDYDLDGIATFDIQYRDGLNGAWINWLSYTGHVAATFSGQDGHTYYFRSRARDYAGNLETYPGGNGDTYTTIDTTPPASAASAPAIATSPQFLVTLNGTDTTSGIASYDIQYRDGALGTWTDWVTSTPQTALQFNGQLGHTYYFQSRARDKAGNLETYPGADGDTHTVTPLYALNGAVKGNRDQAIALANIETTPAALNQPKTDHLGYFSLYYNLSGAVSLTATRSTFGLLPFMPNLIVSDTSSRPIVYLPPLDDQISDGHFESGTLAAWNPSGDLTPTITSTAHTGEYAALLGGIVPSDTVSSGPYLSAIEQTIPVPLTLTDGTLSLLYQVTAADPLSDTLTAYLIGPAETLTLTLPVTATDWTHQWFDVAAWTAPTATLRLELSTPDKERAVGVLIDEITWGSSIIGSRPIYLPIIAR